MAMTAIDTEQRTTTITAEEVEQLRTAVFIAALRDGDNWARTHGVPAPDYHPPIKGWRARLRLIHELADDPIVGPVFRDHAAWLGITEKLQEALY